MPTTQGNRAILDQKRWEWVTPSPVANVPGCEIAAVDNIQQMALLVQSQTVAYLFNAASEGWVLLPSPALASTVAGGAAVAGTNWSAGPTAGASSIAATGGTTTTIATTLSLARDLRGFSLFIMSGPNAGATIPILRNTTGTNSTITVAAQAAAFTASTTFRLMTPRWFAMCAGTVGAGSVRFYDFATNTWTSIGITGLPAINNDSGFTATPSWQGTGRVAFGTGTSSGTNTSTTLNDTSKSWTASQWVNYQIRIVSGTGAGQIRTISASTGTSITVGAAWTTTPDATSAYSIEGNDDFLYLKTSGGGIMYRYSTASNAWTSLANSSLGSASFESIWVFNATDAAWASESAILNGRRIYAFRGSAGAALDYYDIPSNTWVTGALYAPATETFNIGTSYAYANGYIYIQKESTGRWFRLDVATGEMDGWTTMLYTQGVASVGNRAWVHRYRDGSTDIPFVYFMTNALSIVMRQMVY